MCRYERAIREFLNKDKEQLDDICFNCKRKILGDSFRTLGGCRWCDSDYRRKIND